MAALFYPFSRTRIGVIIDGTSTTLMAGEILVVPDPPDYSEIRGRYLDAVHGGTLFTTLRPPNSPLGTWATIAFRSRAPPAGGTTALILPILVHGLFADGSVRWLGDTIDARTYLVLGTRAGSEVTSFE